MTFTCRYHLGHHWSDLGGLDYLTGGNGLFCPRHPAEPLHGRPLDFSGNALITVFAVIQLKQEGTLIVASDY